MRGSFRFRGNHSATIVEHDIVAAVSSFFFKEEIKVRFNCELILREVVGTTSPRGILVSGEAVRGKSNIQDSLVTRSGVALTVGSR